MRCGGGVGIAGHSIATNMYGGTPILIRCALVEMRWQNLTWNHRTRSLYDARELQPENEYIQASGWDSLGGGA